MDLERVQLNEDGSLKPDLQGYASIDVNDEPVDNRNKFQKWVDNRQEAINSSDNTFVKSFAQPVQDLQNIAAHPVQVAKGMVNEAIEHPFKTMAYLNPITFPYVASYDALKPEEGENLSNYMQRIAGHALGAGSIALATMGRGTPKTSMKTMSPIKGSMGGDAITGPAYSVLDIQKAVNPKTGDIATNYRQLVSKKDADAIQSYFYDNPIEYAKAQHSSPSGDIKTFNANMTGKTTDSGSLGSGIYTTDNPNVIGDNYNYNYLYDVEIPSNNRIILNDEIANQPQVVRDFIERYQKENPDIEINPVSLNKMVEHGTLRDNGILGAYFDKKLIPKGYEDAYGTIGDVTYKGRDVKIKTIRKQR